MPLSMLHDRVLFDPLEPADWTAKCDCIRYAGHGARADNSAWGVWFLNTDGGAYGIITHWYARKLCELPQGEAAQLFATVLSDDRAVFEQRAASSPEDMLPCCRRCYNADSVLIALVARQYGPVGHIQCPRCKATAK